MAYYKKTEITAPFTDRTAVPAQGYSLSSLQVSDFTQ